MDYLALNPIGKETKMTDHDTAQILRLLPVRAACIRTGDEQGVIYTLDNPPHVSGPDLKQRVAHIQQQTRDTYCRPRAEVEAMHQTKKGVAPMQQPVAAQSRWEQREQC